VAEYYIPKSEFGKEWAENGIWERVSREWNLGREGEQLVTKLHLVTQYSYKLYLYNIATLSIVYQKLKFKVKLWRILLSQIGIWERGSWRNLGMSGGTTRY